MGLYADGNSIKYLTINQIKPSVKEYSLQDKNSFPSLFSSLVRTLCYLMNFVKVNYIRDDSYDGAYSHYLDRICAW